MFKLRPLALVLIFVINSVNSASTIEEIVVTVKQSNNRALQPIFELNKQALSAKTPLTMADIITAVPSVGIRTNSRGETVFRLRGSEERQSTIFLDGAPLSVPWDGRINLSTLPAGIISHAKVVKSAAPLEYGPNSILGVIELSTDNSCDNEICNLSASLGNNGLTSYDAVMGHNLNRWSASAAISGQNQDHLTVVNRDQIPYAPIDNDKRLNTDSQSRTFWSALNYGGDHINARLSQLVVNASRGIAAAGHLNPTIKKPRYWRYPDWQLSQTTANMIYSDASRWSYYGTAWYQKFSQTIDQYTDATYGTIADSEWDQDRTAGARLVADFSGSSRGYRLIANLQDTVHKQRDHSFENNIEGREEVYQQKLYSLGSEFDVSPTDGLNVSVGLSYDYSDTPQAGGRQAQDKLDDWAGNLAILWTPSDHIDITATHGYRTRFPSLRELYGVALGKFLINPSLKPETAQLTDLTLDWQSNDGAQLLSVTAWTTRVANRLSKRKIIQDGVRFDQRYNMTGSTGQGLEVRAAWQATPTINIEFNANWQDLDAEAEADGQRPEILQRPDIEYDANVTYLFSEMLTASLAAQYIDGSMDENFDGKLVNLPSTTLLDARLFYRLDKDWTTFLSIKNIADSLYLPQLGLPGAGRVIQLGINYKQL